MKNLVLILFCSSVLLSLHSQESKIVYLSGRGVDDAVLWDFYCSKGRQSGEWTKIPVPSNWELHGFGEYNYGHDVPKSDEEGLYKHIFKVPAEWKGQSIKIVFAGSMTDTEVKINGNLAGPLHQGAFYQFEYDISKKLKYGDDNLLEARVSKMSSNESVNAAERKADYWVFGGIFRPVYLIVSPKEHISRVALNPEGNGDFLAEINTSDLKNADNIKLNIFDLSGNKLGQSTRIKLDNKQREFQIENSYDDIKAWNPESPNLYIAQFDLCNENEIIHRYTERFGFRTVEIRQKDGIYVNNVKIMFRGVNRHSFWPESGRALDRGKSFLDVELMKNMNLNAVRMSHYPPDSHFLDICDSLGMFVLNELAGWQKPPYDTQLGKKLVKEMVIRDVNHPSIVLWDNGNEGGWNNELNNEFQKYDPQKRSVIHPWEIYGALDTRHYRDWNFGSGTFFNGKDIFFPTEFLHGLYDGGHGAGLEDWYELMLRKPLSAGGFLWCFADEGIVRTDMDGWIDTKGMNAPDGIVGPYREKEGSYFAIKEIYSPLHLLIDFLPPDFNGLIPVENRFLYTDLKACHFSASWVKSIGKEDCDTILSFVSLMDNIKPGNKGYLKIDKPGNYDKGNYEILILTAKDPLDREIMRWQWPVITPKEISNNLSSEIKLSQANGIETPQHIIMNSNKTAIYISKSSGLIDSVLVEGRKHGLRNGPVHTSIDQSIADISYSQRGGGFLVNVNYSKGKGSIEYELSPNSWLKVSCSFSENGKFDFIGVNFDFPEEKIRSVDLLGDGPYRVWKNRLKGPQFGLWHKEYNNTITGESWLYPEFKGYYSNFYMAEIHSDDLDFICATATDNIYLRLFTPQSPKVKNNDNTIPEFPGGDISFLTAINPIGTKFKNAQSHGPMSQKNHIQLLHDDKPIPLILYFNFEQKD